MNRAATAFFSALSRRISLTMSGPSQFFVWPKKVLFPVSCWLL
jgi:hypothetical protein